MAHQLCNFLHSSGRFAHFFVIPSLHHVLNKSTCLNKFLLNKHFPFDQKFIPDIIAKKKFTRNTDTSTSLLQQQRTFKNHNSIENVAKKKFNEQYNRSARALKILAHFLAALCKTTAKNQKNESTSVIWNYLAALSCPTCSIPEPKEFGLNR